ncbi:hypothetical protein niasHT_010549 [Heterodera trifolii]|uniref:Uncharacterized protein n=1 Tax=Heterodera trifolii TaxID=157864 RepID=A0ABD2L3C6_9BILA
MAHLSLAQIFGDVDAVPKLSPPIQLSDVIGPRAYDDWPKMVGQALNKRKQLHQKIDENEDKEQLQQGERFINIPSIKNIFNKALPYLVKVMPHVAPTLCAMKGCPPGMLGQFGGVGGFPGGGGFPGAYPGGGGFPGVYPGGGGFPGGFQGVPGGVQYPNNDQNGGAWNGGPQ